jgi:hypothetical protein
MRPTVHRCALFEQCFALEDRFLIETSPNQRVQLEHPPLGVID